MLPGGVNSLACTAYQSRSRIRSPEKALRHREAEIFYFGKVPVIIEVIKQIGNSRAEIVSDINIMLL